MGAAEGGNQAVNSSGYLFIHLFSILFIFIF
jgi:hypothetical protein